MPTAKKMDRVEEIQDLLRRASVTIATDYRGLNTADLTALRRRLREARVEFHVVKNSLATRAAEQAERRSLPELLTGPTALALGFGDEVEAARSLTDYIRTSRISLPIRGGVLGERLLQVQEIQSLASLPRREVLLAQFMGGLNAPVAGLVTVLNALLAGLVRVLDARAKQMAEQTPGAALARVAPAAEIEAPTPVEGAPPPEEAELAATEAAAGGPALAQEETLSAGEPGQESPPA